MLRESLAERQIGVEPDFHWRGHEISRMEGFSDAVFAFAITLLVVSLEVPRTFTELAETMRGFPAFGICFLLLMLVWFWHYRFFRRYGLQDPVTIALNGVLLFVVLFYVYPLKFLFTLLLNEFFADPVATGEGPPMIEAGQVGTLMVIYAGGFLALNLIFAILYYRAYLHHAALALNPRELYITVSAIQSFLLSGAVAVLSLLIAVGGGAAYAALAGLAYMLIMPVQTFHGMYRGAQWRKRAAAAPRPTEAATSGNG